MIGIEYLNKNLETKFNKFLLENPKSQIYSSIEYRNFLCRAVGGTPKYLIALDQADQIVGFLGYFKYNVDDVGTVINSLPWYGSHGGCILKNPKDIEVRKQLLLKYYNEIQFSEVLSSTIILSTDEEIYLKEYCNILKPDEKDKRIGQITNLPNYSDNLDYDLERILLQKTRNLTRKSLKQDFKFQIRDDDLSWKYLFDTHVENMREIGGKPKKYTHFQALREEISPNSRHILIAEFNEKPVAALLLLYFNKTVEYFIPVITYSYRSKQPLSFLIWKGMLNSVKEGYKWWNWGGTWSSQKSLHHFKKGWGAVDTPYSYLITSSVSGRAILRKNKSKIEELFSYYYVYPSNKL